MTVPSLPGYKSQDLPPISVETFVPAEMLGRMLTRIENIFNMFSEGRTHWTVLGSDRYRPEQFEEHRARFFESGREAVRILGQWAARAGLDLTAYRTCLDLGCGVGRVSVALAEVFPRVIGVDVATPMLEEAERSAAAFNVTNVRWLLANRFAVYDDLPEIDMLFSVISLQHNPPPVMRHLLTRLLGKLRPGGIAFFQVPTYRAGYSFNAEKYLASPVSKDVEMHVFPQRHLFELLRSCGCRILEVREDGYAGAGSMTHISNSFFVEKG